jgi:type I restriction-modification system DNA methylase subunit
MGDKEHKSEVDAYAYIKSELKSLGWDTRNPAIHPQGQVYTQNQCLSDPEIKKWLDKTRPEYIVKVNELVLWIIEAKNKKPKIDQAMSEAENDYANKVNQSSLLKASFISGVAGNDADGFTIKNKFLENGLFRSIALNDKEMTGLLSPEITKRILLAQSASLKDVPVDQAFFMQKARRINEILHIGAIPINERARTMAALLLSTLYEDIPNLSTSPTVLIADINTRAKNALEREGKGEFYDFVRLSLPTTIDNHVRYKKALVDTLRELYSLNIKSAMNSGTDVLGQFYEVFLKYGNWAQKMGIVLTPRHITKFAVDALDVTPQDVVYDPTCGTGGFLVAAFDHIRSCANPKQVDQFKLNIFGMDLQPQLACLAIVNMIFRGDGKDNIVDGDCFNNWLVGTEKENKSVGFPIIRVKEKPATPDLNMVTRVLMNPSFAIQKSDMKEYKFVQHALDQMVDSGLLFSVLPMGAMFEQGEEKAWRENHLLKENTLLAVVTFPPELFHYTADVYTVGIFVKKGIPHPKSQKVFWARAIHDGMIKKKDKRLPDPTGAEPNDLATILPILRAFIHDPSFSVNSEPELYKVAPINPSDTSYELVPEAYLDSRTPSVTELKNEVDRLTREQVSYLIRKGEV